MSPNKSVCWNIFKVFHAKYQCFTRCNRWILRSSWSSFFCFLYRIYCLNYALEFSGDSIMECEGLFRSTWFDLSEVSGVFVLFSILLYLWICCRVDVSIRSFHSFSECQASETFFRRWYGHLRIATSRKRWNIVIIIKNGLIWKKNLDPPPVLGSAILYSYLYSKVLKPYDL